MIKVHTHTHKRCKRNVIIIKITINKNERKEILFKLFYSSFSLFFFTFHLILSLIFFSPMVSYYSTLGLFFCIIWIQLWNWGLFLCALRDLMEGQSFLSENFKGKKGSITFKRTKQYSFIHFSFVNFMFQLFFLTFFTLLLKATACRAENGNVIKKYDNWIFVFQWIVILTKICRFFSVFFVFKRKFIYLRVEIIFN